jgi:MFS family permease
MLSLTDYLSLPRALTISRYRHTQSLFGPAHLGAILGYVSGITHLAVALGPLLFGEVHRQYGSFRPVLGGLAAWGLISAVCIVCSPPPLGLAKAKEAGGAAGTPAISRWRERKLGWKMQQRQRTVAPVGVETYQQ